jgi:hypothetical protein
MNPKSLLFHKWAVLLLLLPAGCGGSALVHLPLEMEQKLLPELEDGASTREEILTRLGTPSLQLEDRRILMFRMTSDAHEHLAVARRGGESGWAAAEYSLVLAFDEQGVLVRHRLIQVKD